MKPVLLSLGLLLVMKPPFAQAKTAASVAQLLMQIEHEWSEADVKKDAAALNRILADDWLGIDFHGVALTKAEVLKDVSLNSDATSTEMTQLGAMKVRVYGNTAIVNGRETEKSRYLGEDSSGEYVWTDVFVFRNGRWQAVSSQSTKLATQDGAR